MKQKSAKKIALSCFCYLGGVAIYFLSTSLFKVPRQTFLGFWIIALLILVLFNQHGQAKKEGLSIKDIALDFTLGMFISYGRAAFFN